MSAKDLTRERASRSPEEAALEAIRTGYRERDAAKVMSAYAENVGATIVNRNEEDDAALLKRYAAEWGVKLP